MRRARSSAARTAGSSSTTMTEAVAGAVMLWSLGRARRRERSSGRRGRALRTSRAPQETPKDFIRVPEETRGAPAPRRGGTGTARGVGQSEGRRSGPLVGARAELDLDVARRAAPADLQGHLVARLVAVDRVDERVGAGDRATVDRGDDVAVAQAGVGGGTAAGDLADRGAGARRRVGELHAEVGVGDLAAGDELLGDALDHARRDREADAVVAAGVALDLRIDADHVAAGVEQRAARVAVVDRGVGLDRAR